MPVRKRIFNFKKNAFNTTLIAADNRILNKEGLKLEG